LNTLRAFGYELTEKVVDAADFGDPQHRERLFIMGKLGGPAPRFPRATHGAAGSGLLPFVTARQIVDWTNVGVPVEQKRRLTPRTRQVIARGLEEFGGEPFLIPRMRHNNNPVRSIDRPLMTVTCTSWDIGLVTPRAGKVFHRSLNTHELKRAMGLPADYRVLGQTEARPLLERLGLPTDCSLRSVPSVRSDSEFRTVQIGNAVCVGAVAACIESLMAT
jgi:site-specific DNA-cytosine methylase